MCFIVVVWGIFFGYLNLGWFVCWCYKYGVEGVMSI